MPPNSSPGTDRVYGVQASAGTLLWQRTRELGPGEFIDILAADDRAVYLADPSHLSAWEVHTGKDLWSFPALDTTTVGGRALSNGVWYLAERGSTQGTSTLYALQATTGQPLWNTAPKGILPDWKSLTVVAGLALILAGGYGTDGQGGQVYAIASTVGRHSGVLSRRKACCWTRCAGYFPHPATKKQNPSRAICSYPNR